MDRAALTRSSAPPPTTQASTENRYSHRHQFELRAGGFEGFGFAVRYEGAHPNCDPQGHTFCYGRSPVVIDSAIGFGVTDTVELEARFRTGEIGFTGALPLAAGIGVRVYSSPLQFKWVFGAAVLADFTDAGNQSNWGTDILARVEGGIHYDVVREFGFYIQLGATFGFLRSLALTLDGGVGVQLRLP